jgi:SAM-dependent methyltransferase
MKETLINILRDPYSGEKLVLSDATYKDGEIWEGRLSCESGARSYPVIRGIPRFVSSDEYTGSFSLEWKIHKKTQLDSETSRESWKTFSERTGLSAEELKGKLVLDAGVGMGRYADIALKGGATVVGVDLSLAVESAYENLGKHAAFSVVQADIFHLPFEKELFDVIFSMGVLHHTPDCRKAFASLLRFLKPGGDVAIWVYAWQGFHSIRSNFWRFFTTKIPPSVLYAIIKNGLPIWEFFLKLPMIGKTFKIIPTSGHPIKQWRILDTFDWYSAKYQSKHRWEEVEGWFRKAGLVKIRRLGFPVSIRGKKKADT